MKLVQKQFLKGTREFEIIDDTVYVQIKGLMNKETHTVALSTLDPVPVINGGKLEFYSKHQGRPLLSLYVNTPSAAEVDAFVDALKQKIPGASDSVAETGPGTVEDSLPEAPGWNVYEEPPKFGDDETQESKEFKPVNAERVEQDIALLKNYLQESDIKPLLDACEALKQEPASESAMQQVVEAYNGLGFYQGAVLTYAPYLKVLLSRYIW